MWWFEALFEGQKWFLSWVIDFQVFYPLQHLQHVMILMSLTLLNNQLCLYMYMSYYIKRFDQYSFDIGEDISKKVILEGFESVFS